PLLPEPQYSDVEVNAMSEIVVPAGLEGVVVCETSLSEIEGNRGLLTYRGIPIQQVVAQYHWETLITWLVTGRTARPVPPSKVSPAVSSNQETSPLAMLAEEVLHSRWSPDVDFGEYISRLPLTLASRRGLGEDPGDGLVALRYLSLMREKPPTSLEAEALDAYWVMAAEHSLNASTFAVRISASTGASLPMALVSGIGVLAGPLHGGAPTGVLRLLEEAAAATDIRKLLTDKLDRGERLMGFGHRVYRTMDPRADALRAVFQRLAWDHDMVRLALAVETTALDLLRSRKPNRVLATNVEFYAGALLYALDIPESWCPATFACGRLAGWTAHYMEQRAEGRLIRPLARYRVAEE
ncbi:MAG: citrate synthase, partial [Firmicutes bacterium]|nr:citrate synthase [Bacillota bacterium]